MDRNNFIYLPNWVAQGEIRCVQSIETGKQKERIDRKERPHITLKIPSKYTIKWCCKRAIQGLTGRCWDARTFPFVWAARSRARSTLARPLPSAAHALSSTPPSDPRWPCLSLCKPFHKHLERNKTSPKEFNKKKKKILEKWPHIPFSHYQNNVAF